MSRKAVFLSTVALSLFAALPAFAEDDDPGLTVGAGVEVLSPDLFEEAEFGQFVSIGLESGSGGVVRGYLDVGVTFDLAHSDSLGFHVGTGMLTMNDLLRTGVIVGRNGIGSSEEADDLTVLLGDVGVYVPLGAGFSLSPGVQMGYSFENGGGLASGLNLMLEKRF